MSTPVALLPKIRSDAIMSAAEGQPCAIRVASLIGKSCAGIETTVGCHLPVIGKGTGTKVTDLAVAFGCSVCHDIVDGRDKVAHDVMTTRYPAAYAYRLLNALVETQARLVEAGVITVKDGKVI